MRRLLLIALLLPAMAAARDLGVIGPTYAINEPDMLAQLHTRLKQAETDGTLQTMEDEMKARYVAHAQRPKGIALPRADQHRVHFFDPTVVLSQDIRDQRGQVLWQAGTKVNPLDYVSMNQQWLFFDGDDPQQRQWARDYLTRYPNQVRPILTQGEALKLSEDWGVRLYFDQHGSYSRRFGLRALPALLSQQGKQLRIDEIAPETPHD